MASNTTTPVNPFVPMRAALRGAFYLTHGEEYVIQTSVLFAVTALSLVCVVVALVVRCRKQGFWLVRLTTTAAGRWITPHPIFCWLIFSIWFHGMMWAYLIMMTRYGIEGSNLMTTMIWRSSCWIPLWLAGWPMLWATALGPILARTPNPHARFDIANYPALFNAFFLSLPVILLGTMLPLIASTNWHFNRAFGLFQTLDAGLTQAIAAFNSGASIGDPRPLFALQGQLVIESGEIITHWQRVWIAWTCFNVAFVTMFSTAGFIHLRHLSVSMRHLRATAGTDSSGSRQMKSLRAAYLGLTFMMLMALINGMTYATIGTIAAIDAADLLIGSRLTEVLSLLGIYPYACFGTLCNVLILIRSFATSPVTVASTGSDRQASQSHKYSTSESWRKPLPVGLTISRPMPTTGEEWMELKDKPRPLELV